MVTLLSAPTALPRSTRNDRRQGRRGRRPGPAWSPASLVRFAGGVVIAASSFFLQPASATVAKAARRDGQRNAVPDHGWWLLWMRGIGADRRRWISRSRPEASTWPGKILSGSSIWSRLASKIARPSAGLAVMLLRDVRERVALLHGVVCSPAPRHHRRPARRRPCRPRWRNRPAGAARAAAGTRHGVDVALRWKNRPSFRPRARRQRIRVVGSSADWSLGDSCPLKPRPDSHANR